jgi:hypothetical protein
MGGCVTEYGYIWCMASATSPYTQVQHAQAVQGGTLGWVSQTSNTLLWNSAVWPCVLSGSYIYCMGGGTGNPYDGVEYAQV